jgi:hypothetical protein
MPHTLLVEVSTAHGRLDGLAAGEPLLQAVIMRYCVLAIPPAKPNGPAVDMSVEVDEARLRVLEHCPHLFDFAPRLLIDVDTPEKVLLEVTYFRGVASADFDSLRHSSEKLGKVLEPSLDLGAPLHLSADQGAQTWNERVDRLEREDRGSYRHLCAFMMQINR